MNWKKYRSSAEEYHRLIDRYDLRLEYIHGEICLKDGTTVILLGGVAPEEPSTETALVMISDVTKEEIEHLANYVATLRQKRAE